MGFEHMFVVGDRVRVISDCRTYLKVGTVINIFTNRWNKNNYASVRLDNGASNNYNELSLQKIGHVDLATNNKENNMALKGNFRVAVVKHIQGYDVNKEYGFALFDSDINDGDLVLCDNSNGYTVAKVVRIESQVDYGKDVTREIICKCDFTNFNNRKFMREKQKALKAQMDKMVKENQDLILYQAIAEKNPDMKALLDQYKALGEV